MRQPTAAQQRSLYFYCHYLTEVLRQPIHMMRIDERTGNLFVLAGIEESIEFQIRPDGSLEDEYD
jgi:hypothetical protein